MDEIYEHAFHVCAIWDTSAFWLMNYCSFDIEPHYSDIYVYHWCPQTLAEICRNMGICCGFRAVAARGKYLGSSYFTGIIFFIIVRFGYRLGLPSAPFHYGLMWAVGIPTILRTPVTVLLHSPNCRQAWLPLGLCKGTVKESKIHWLLSKSILWLAITDMGIMSVISLEFYYPRTLTHCGLVMPHGDTDQGQHHPDSKVHGANIWGPSGADRTKVGPMLAPWTLLSG